MLKMGTNYYLVKNAPSIQEPVHIGKSSAGWLFSFETQEDPWWGNPKVEWHTYNQVKDTLKRLTVDSNEYVIMNEYDDIVSYNDFIALVDRKQNDELCQSNPDNFEYSTNIDGYRFQYGWFR